MVLDLLVLRGLGSLLALMAARLLATIPSEGLVFLEAVPVADLLVEGVQTFIAVVPLAEALLQVSLLTISVAPKGLVEAAFIGLTYDPYTQKTYENNINVSSQNVETLEILNEF